MIRRPVRSLSLCLLLPLAGCGYFSGNWPTLEQDPLPERPEATPRETDETLAEPPAPAPDDRRPAIETTTQAASRLTEHESRLAELEMEADAQLAALIADPRTPEEWGQAQISASRLTRTEGDLRALSERVTADAARLEHRDTPLAEEAPEFRTLARRITALGARVREARRDVEARLAGRRPEERPASEQPATPLPEGRPALTISADARADTYSQAVSTLVEKAQAINSTNVYHVVAAGDETAAMRARNVRSLLAAGGVAERHIRMLTDPAGDAGSVRIFVE